MYIHMIYVYIGNSLWDICRFNVEICEYLGMTEVCKIY